ncbi:MAG: glycosyltransferase family 4 protein [Candidatus Micrarchaeota archaeon]|nr:glycosyltransferase family 4 protein [Candidatus Micrarchaeota archaeon]
MRIAFASDSAYPWFNGGIEKRRYIIMRKLAEEGHEVHCFTMHRKNMPGHVFTYKGIRYHSVGEALGWEGMYRGGSKRRSIRMPLIFSAQLFWKILPYRFDAVDADNFPFLHLFPLFFYSKIRGARFAITWHEVWSAGFWKRYLSGLGILGYFVEWISARMADVHIANSSTTKRLLISELGADPDKIIVFPVAVDTEEMRRYSRIRYRKKDQFLVASRLVGHKRVELAISAIAKTKAKLLVIGTGPDEEKLVRLASEVAPGQVTFKHSLPTEQHYRSFLESRALIMPSAREGLSLVTVEALALGVPVVVANTSSLPEEVKSMCLETGEDRLGSMLNKILANSKRYENRAMGLREKVLREFSGDDAGKVYEQVVES